MSSEISRRVLEAQPEGLCAGVVRSFQGYDLMREVFPDGPIYSVGEPAHNTYVIQRYKSQGFIFVKHVSQVPDGEKAVFGPHGSTPEDIEIAKAKKLTFVDTECPLVTKVKREVEKNAQKGYTTLYHGQRNHAEARAVMGVAPDDIILVENLEEALAANVPDSSKVAFNTQTTHNYDESIELAEILKRKKYPNLLTPPIDDACFATRNRQKAVKEMVVGGAEFVCVLGSPTSSNSKRLAEVAKNAGADVLFIDSAGELEMQRLNGYTTVGFSAGASVESIQVEELKKLLTQNGEIETEIVSVADESKIQFAPPVIQRPEDYIR